MIDKLYILIAEAMATKFHYDIVGYLAAFFSTISLLPQIIKLYRERSAKAISVIMYSLYSAGTILWLVYGILLSSAPLIITEVITLLFASTILIMKLKWDKH